VDNPAFLASAPGPIAPGSLGGDVLNNALYAVTATVQYDLWKNVLSRIEFRWDHSEHGMAFGGVDANTEGPNRSNAYMLAANIIYKF
jgi:hypothetical protein